MVKSVSSPWIALVRWMAIEWETRGLSRFGPLEALLWVLAQGMHRSDIGLWTLMGQGIPAPTPPDTSGGVGALPPVPSVCGRFQPGQGRLTHVN
uniref:Uncharacterized protein n=1 Tax=Oryza rufipogon TaxID=4529 RepID=A0A0E0N2F9_ORYRU